MFKCSFCNKSFQRDVQRKSHERLCKHNDNRVITHTKIDESSSFRYRDGTYSNKSIKYIKEYINTHYICEICGKDVRCSSTKYNHLCIDHDHNTGNFRGGLCSSCNRALGWYENNKDAINNYLNSIDK